MSPSPLDLSPTLNADLHCHSVVSDGTQTPQWLAQHASANGVQLWALTDHDELGGVAAAQAAASVHGLAFLTGVEISVTWLRKTIHIVGLGFDARNTALAAGLQRTRGGREARAHDMAQQLAAIGIPGAFEGAFAYAGNPDLISRSHFARFLVETGVCRDIGEVFRNYLTEGKPGYVEHRWATLEDAVGWITDAGGMAVIAHPARYDLTALEEDALFTRFKVLGGQGVEVATASHSAEEMHAYHDKARAYELYASRGSDFHSPAESRIELGQIAPLPASLAPVWQPLAHRIIYPTTSATTPAPTYGTTD